MPNIYTINYATAVTNLLPPQRRTSFWVAFCTILTYPIQYLNDLFVDYLYGATYAYWVTATVYVVNQKVTYFDNAIYICTVAHTSGATFDLTKFTKVQDFKAGVFERLNYNDQKFVLEAVLNKWFDYYAVIGMPIYITRVQAPPLGFYVSSREDISSTVTSKDSEQIFGVSSTDYSSDSSVSFIVHVKLAQFNALAATNLERESIIRSVVDRHNSAGFIYTVATY